MDDTVGKEEFGVVNGWHGEVENGFELSFGGASLHHAQIFGEFVRDAGSGSRILRLRRTILLLFGNKNSKILCFDSFVLNRALKIDAEGSV